MWGLLSGSDPSTHPSIEATIIDPDRVSLSNLNRQVLYTEADIGEFKAPLLVRRVSELFRKQSESFTLKAAPEALTTDNINALLAPADLVIDCTDSVETKLLVNDYCTSLRKSFCYTGVVGDHGQFLFVNQGVGSHRACLRCLFESYTDSDFLHEARSCRSAGIFGPVAGTVGFLVAEHTLRFLNNCASPCAQLVRTSLDHPLPKYADVLPSPNCPLGCGEKRVIALDLTDLQCPSTFLYTKLALERLAEGETLDVRFQNQDSVMRVAESCEDLGYTVLAPGRQISKSLWRLLIRHP